MQCYSTAAKCLPTHTTVWCPMSACVTSMRHLATCERFGGRATVAYVVLCSQLGGVKRAEWSVEGCVRVMGKLGQGAGAARHSLETDSKQHRLAARHA